MRGKPVSHLLGLVALLLALSTQAHAQTFAYNVIDLGVSGTYTESYGNGLSNTGYAVGDLRASGSDPNRGFRWLSNVQTQIPFPANPDVLFGGATGVNNAGTAVGTTFNLDNSDPDPQNWIVYNQAFHYNGTTSTAIPFLLNGYTNTATKVNNQGIVTGSSNRTAPNDPVAGDNYAYTYNIGTNTLTELPRFFGGADRTVGNDIGDEDGLGRVYVVGEGTNNVGAGNVQRAFRWRTGDGALTAIPVLNAGDPDANSFNSTARGVNNAGLTVGTSDIDIPSEFLANAFLWDGANLIDLGKFAGDDISEAYAINNLNQIVGNSYQYDPLGFPSPVVNPRAFLLNYSGNPSSPGSLIDLNTQIDPLLGWTLQYATDINDNGWIVGFGLRFNPNTFQDEVRGFLLIPTVIPEPSTLAFGSLGVAGLLYLRRQRRLKADRMAHAHRRFDAA